MEHLCKVPVLLRVLKGDEVHASLTTKVPSVEPVPVLELVPRLPPGEEVVVLPVLLVVLSTKQKQSESRSDLVRLGPHIADRDIGMQLTCPYRAPGLVY